MAAIAIWQNDEKEIAPCENFFWINSLINFYLIKQLDCRTTNVLNNPTSAYF